MQNNQANTVRRPNLPPNMRPLPPLAESIKKVQQAAPAPAPAPAPVPAPPVAPPPVQQAHTSDMGSEELQGETLQDIPLVDAATYLSMGSKDQGFVEFDLMSHRERGNEVRYLSIQVRGFSLDEKGKVSSAYMAIMNREEFDKVKSFFSTLKWED